MSYTLEIDKVLLNHAEHHIDSINTNPMVNRQQQHVCCSQSTTRYSQLCYKTAQCSCWQNIEKEKQTSRHSHLWGLVQLQALVELPLLPQLAHTPPKPPPEQTSCLPNLLACEKEKG